MDWNWFFSSMAQAMAALVGVLAAFLISKLIASEAKYSASRRATAQLVRRSERLKDLVSARDFDMYNLQSLKYALKDLSEDLRGSGDILGAEAYYASYAFPRFVPRDIVLEKINSALEAEHLRRATPARPLAARAVVPNLDFRPQGLQVEGDAIRTVLIELKVHLREVEEHLADVSGHPERSAIVRSVLLALVLLFLLGVVIPLGTLPVGDGGTSLPFGQTALGISVIRRTFLVTSTSLVFLAMLVALGVINERLVHPKADIEALQDWLLPDRYSTYLQVFSDNGYSLRDSHGLTSAST